MIRQRFVDSMSLVMLTACRVAPSRFGWAVCRLPPLHQALPKVADKISLTRLIAILTRTNLVHRGMQSSYFATIAWLVRCVRSDY
jgi:hypothetical protein